MDVELERLLRYLREQGATDDEVTAALEAGSVGGLALDLAVRTTRAVRPFDDAIGAAGIDPGVAAAYWRALGFPDPGTGSSGLTDDEVAALRLIVEADRDLLGHDATLALARVLGTTTSRIAQALVDVIRVEVEGPQLASGRPYTEIVASYADLAREMLPRLLDAVGTVMVRHLVAVASGTWSADTDGGTGGRDLAVGFADLSGYTALSRTLPSRQLARMINDFESVVSDAAARRGGRIVKLIGDGAMFSGTTSAIACRIAWDVMEAAPALESLPPVRVGLSSGRVVALHGDLFGDVVNLAARLVAVAPGGGIVVSERVAEEAASGFEFEALPPQELKGFGPPAPAFLLRRPTA